MTVRWTVRAALDRGTQKRRNPLAFSSQCREKSCHSDQSAVPTAKRRCLCCQISLFCTRWHSFVMNTRTKKQPKTSFLRLVFGYFLSILHKSSFFLDHMKPLFSGLFEEKYTHKNEGFENFSRILFFFAYCTANFEGRPFVVAPFAMPVSPFSSRLRFPLSWFLSALRAFPHIPLVSWRRHSWICVYR